MCVCINNTGVVSFVTMKAFRGTAITSSFVLKFGTRCCSVVSCPLELRRKNLLFPLCRMLRKLQSQCVRTFSEYPGRVCSENDFDLRQKVCVSDLRGLLLLLPLTHVGSITRRNVMFGDSTHRGK